MCERLAVRWVFCLVAVLACKSRDPAAPPAPPPQPAPPVGALADFPVDWVIGGKRMQDDVTVFPDGRWQVLPVYFHTTKHEWVDYTESKQGALTPDHPFYWTNARRMANHECLDCHTTNLAVS